MNNLENAAECARRAMVFYEEDDQESLGTALKLLYTVLIKESPDVRSGLNGEMDIGSNEKDEPSIYEEPIKPFVWY